MIIINVIATVISQSTISPELINQVLDNNSLILILPNHWRYTIPALLLLGIISFIVLFIKLLPSHILGRSLKKLDEKIDHINIVRAQVEPKKVEAYIKFSDAFGDMFADPESFTRDIQTGKKKQSEMKKVWYDLGAKLFFFASDNTIRKYLELRACVFNPSNFLQGQLKDPMIPIKLYAEIIESMRKDLGYNDTKCSADDFLKTIM